MEYGSARVPPAIGAIDRVNAGLQKEPEEKKDEAERERGREGKGKREVHTLQECVSREQAIFD